MEKKIHVVLEVFSNASCNGNEIIKHIRPINWFMNFKAALKCCKLLERKYGFTNALYSLGYEIRSLNHHGLEMADYRPLHPIN